MGFKTQYFPDDMCMSVMYTMCRYIDLLLVLLCSRVGQCLQKVLTFLSNLKKKIIFFFAIINEGNLSWLRQDSLIRNLNRLTHSIGVYYKLLLFHGLASAFIFLIWYSRVKFWCIGLQSGVEQWRSDSLERIAIYVWKYWP